MANKIQGTGKLIGNRYFLLDELGMYWDLQLLFRQNYSDEADFNNAIDENNELIKISKKYQAGWFVSIGMVPSQINALGEDWKKLIQPKVHLFLYDDSYKPAQNNNLMPVIGMFEADFLWHGDNLVYTWMSGDNLNYRFRQVSKDEVDRWVAESNEIPAEDNGGSEPEESNGLTLHIVCPHCGKRIF
jgi:hypothetical protein